MLLVPITPYGIQYFHGNYNQSVYKPSWIYSPLKHLGQYPTQVSQDQEVMSTSSVPNYASSILQDSLWNMDTGASSYLNSDSSHSILPTLHRPLHLHNVLVTPNIIKNLIYVCQFTRDNNFTIKFDAFRFSFKDFLTRHILLRCDNSGDLYPVTQLSSLPSALMSLSSSTWNQRLGHPGDEVLRCLVSRNFISCNKEKSHHVCHACQLGKHVKLPFTSSTSIDGTCKTTQRLNLHVSHISPIPKSPSLALSDPYWRDAIFDEYNALIKNDTWVLIPRPSVSNNVWSLWLFQHKFHADGSLGRSLYVLKQAPNAWFHRFADYATRIRFSPSRYDSSLFIYSMLNCNPNHTPVDTESKHGPERTPISDLTLYRSLASGLQYVTFTRPNLSYVVQQIFLYMHDPWEPHLAALKRILRYVQGTLQFGLQLYASSGSSFVAYFDVDWAGCPGTCRSTSGYSVFMGENLLSWPAM
ncbi:ribonuclease H-like domain-containing protein [Tanacetum coccineum]